jgi:hypothetical protein
MLVHTFSAHVDRSYTPLCYSQHAEMMYATLNLNETDGDEHLSSKPLVTVVNNQLSGAGKVEINLIDFLFKPSIYLYRFNSSPIGLDT